MKRILSLVLILALSLCLFAGCQKQPETTGAAAVATVEDAATYLHAMYKEDDGSIVRRDFKRVAIVMVDGEKFEVSWASDSADVTIGNVENSQVTIDINEEPAADVTFTLTATVKDTAGNTKSVTFTHTILAPKASGTVFVKVPEVDTAYKFALEQNELGKTLYFTGEMSGFYLAMSENPFDAVDVFVENVDGGQRIYFLKEEVKTYIDIVPRGEDQPGKVNVVLTEAPTAVYTWDAERKTYTAKVEENTWYLGTYSTYNTISASNVSYIEDVSKIGDSQFPAGFCTVTITPNQVKAPAVNTAYKFALVQNEIGQTLYFTGEMSGFYLAMSQNPAEGVNIFIEDVDGGQRIYFMKGEVKTYIDIVPRGADQPGKVNVILTEAPSAVFTWDAERLTYTAKVEENTWYLGTYSTYNTISASNVSYIEDVSKIGDSQFPAGPYIVDGFMEMQPDFSEPETPDNPEKPDDNTFGMITAPVAGTAYKLGLVHGGKGNSMMYFTGAEKPNYPWYMLSTTNIAEAVDVFVEEVDGGLRLYFMASGTKTYLDMHRDGTHYSLRLTTEPAAVYTWNTEHNTFVATVDDKACFIGTSGTYDTFSCNKMDDVANSYVAHLYGQGGAVDTPVTPEKPDVPAADSKLSVKDAIDLGASMEHNVYTDGKYYVTGVITEIYNETYGNMKITDADGNILTVYGTFDADGTNRFDAMEVKPIVGDTITVYGIIGQYNGTPQIKNGWIVKIGAESEGNGTIADGNQVMIYYPDGDSYVTATLDGKKLAAGTEAEAAVWTVAVNADGYYMFACDGKYLTSGATGNSMSLEETANEYSLWELIVCEDGYYLRNVNAAYNGNANQYLEFYSGFTTYGFNESKANIYTFQFVIVE